MLKTDVDTQDCDFAKCPFNINTLMVDISLTLKLVHDEIWLAMKLNWPLIKLAGGEITDGEMSRGEL